MGYVFIMNFIYIIMIMLIYFSKKRVDNLDNKIYSTILVLNSVGVVVDILQFILIKNSAPTNVILFVNKLFLIYVITWTAVYNYYVISIRRNDEKIIRSNIVKLLLLTYVIFVVIVIALPVSYRLNDDGTMYSTGLAVKFAYGAVSYYILIMFVSMIINLTHDHKNSEKYKPVLSFLVLGSISGLLQMMNPILLLTSPVETFVTILTYFFIENPDIKMLNEVTAAKDAADKANRAKSDFLSSMSHEIRTPLNAIVGFSECIKNADSLEEAKENAADIVTASESLLEIVNGILDISKIESGKLELVQSDYDIYKILDEVVKLIKARLGDKPLNFEVNIAPDIPHVLYGDHFNIKKILINFLTNAVKYTDEGYVKFDVKCVIVNNNVCRLIMSVKDSGRGIKKENIDKLFTKFQRLDEDKNTTIEGTGLGLAITKQLVEMMHGKIVVNSIYGEGSEFTVAIDQRISNHKLETQEDISDDVIDLTGRKILVVDDNKLNLKVAVKLLQPYKCVVETCESGFGCIDKITSGNKYDIILLDDMMPNMDGIETFKQLHEDPSFKTPVISLTADAVVGAKDKFINAGFNGYVSKPIDKKMLDDAINKALKD
ncbi:two component system histidine kinase/response regulator hybrid protein [Firmicutes bacterium CAG:582]|nr:two component system histidine kinase/response regulator hybrid protein [Firmicutes bacterium CAG:582]